MQLNLGIGEFLLGMAGLSATLFGAFLIGVFFYIDSELHRQLSASKSTDVFLRSGMRWVFTAYSVPLLAPLALVTLDPVWGALTFIVLALMLLLATVDTGVHILMKGASGASRGLVVNHWLTSAAVIVAVILPWTLGGWVPSAAAFIPSLLILLASGFASTAALVMAEWDATMGMSHELSAGGPTNKSAG